MSCLLHHKSYQALSKLNNIIVKYMHSKASIHDLVNMIWSDDIKLQEEALWELSKNKNLGSSDTAADAIPRLVGLLWPQSSVVVQQMAAEVLMILAKDNFDNQCAIRAARDDTPNGIGVLTYLSLSSSDAGVKNIAVDVLKCIPSPVSDHFLYGLIGLSYLISFT